MNRPVKSLKRNTTILLNHLAKWIGQQRARMTLASSVKLLAGI